MHITFAMPRTATSISYVMTDCGHYYSAAHRKTVSEAEDRDYNIPVIYVDVINDNETPTNETTISRN